MPENQQKDLISELKNATAKSIEGQPESWKNWLSRKFIGVRSRNSFGSDLLESKKWQEEHSRAIRRAATFKETRSAVPVGVGQVQEQAAQPVSERVQERDYEQEEREFNERYKDQLREVYARQDLTQKVNDYENYLLQIVDQDETLLEGQHDEEIRRKLRKEFEMFNLMINEISPESKMAVYMIDEFMEILQSAIYPGEKNSEDPSQRIIFNRDRIDRTRSQIGTLRVYSESYIQKEKQSQTISDQRETVTNARVLREQGQELTQEKLDLQEALWEGLMSLEHDLKKTYFPEAPYGRESEEKIEQLLEPFRDEISEIDLDIPIDEATVKELLGDIENTITYDPDRQPPKDKLFLHAYKHKIFRNKIYQLKMQEIKKLREKEDAEEEKRVPGTNFSLN